MLLMGDFFKTPNKAAGSDDPRTVANHHNFASPTVNVGNAS